MRQLYKFLTLSADERRLLVKASVLLVLIRLTVGRVPFRTLSRLVIGRTRKDDASPHGDRRLADQVVWAVTAVSQRAPRWTTCLTRALTVQAMLARRGYPSRLHVGVMRGMHGALEGHAWVEREGRVLIGGSTTDLTRFARLAAFDVYASDELAAGRLQAGR